MNNYPSLRRALWIRLACAAPLFVAGWVVVTHLDGGWAAAGPALFAMALFIAGAVIVAPTIAALAAEPAGSIFMPPQHADRPAPMYGIADTRRVKGDPEGAMAYLEQILAEHPHELDAYVKMMDIAVIDLHDRLRAGAIYKRGVTAMETDGDKAALAAMYRAIASRYKDPLQPAHKRNIRLPRG